MIAKKFASNSGMSLLGAVIAVGIVSVLALTISTLLVNMFSALNRVNLKAGEGALISELFMNTYSQQLCTAALGGAGAQVFSAAEATTAAGWDLNLYVGGPTPQIVRDGTDLSQKYDLIVSRLRFAEAVDKGLTSNNLRQYLGKLQLAAQSSKQMIGGSSLKSKIVSSLMMLVRADGRVEACYGPGGGFTAPPNQEVILGTLACEYSVTNTSQTVSGVKFCTLTTFEQNDCGEKDDTIQRCTLTNPSAGTFTMTAYQRSRGGIRCVWQCFN